MPIPTKRANEKESAFISRCMGNETMLKDYPDQKQRSAICFSQWRKDTMDAEASTKSWAAVDKSKLPKSAFLWIEGDGKTKAQWHLPVYEGAGSIDPDTGMYKERGPINLNALRAASAAIAGARTGKPMGIPAEVKSKLESLLKRYKIGERKDIREIKLDALKKDKYEITDQGFLKAESLATRVGVFEYSHPDGSVTKEFRAPEEVFDEDSMKSLQLIPITRNHPPGMVDVKNLKKYQIGYTGEVVEQRGDHIGCTVMITDEKEVESILGKFDTMRMTDEISLGYKCDVIPEAGEWNGEPYDHRQTNIKYNHLSLIDGLGRAGRDVRLRLDQKTKEDIVMFRFKKDKIEIPGLHMDAIDIEIPDEATPIVEKLSDKLDGAVKIIDYLGKMGDAIQARYDAVIEEIETIKKDLESWQNPNSDKVQSMLKSRKDLEDLADKFKVEHKDKSDKDIRIDIIKTVSPDFDPKDRSDEYLQARFETIREMAEKTDSGDESMRTFIRNAESLRQDAGQPKDPRKDYIDRTQALYKDKTEEQTAAK